MPTVLRIRGYRFHFYANESLEPPHIHIRSGGGTAKFWLAPVALAEWRRYSQHELNTVRELVLEHRQELLNAWDAYFGGQ